ncbi:MAG: hypothetical protein PVI13_03525 [Desulfobacterales bacterium]|jgi:hypothetical protein
MEIPSELISVIERNAFRKASPAVQILIDDILARHGQAAQGILFYGSCMRSGDDLDGLVDLYLIVDSYRNAYSGSGRVSALLNALLPPNVFYLECQFGGQTVRTKYAVISVADFQKGTSKRWFHSYLWGRFSQPTAILYARNEEVAKLVLKGFARSVLTFVNRVMPRISAEFNARQLWGRGLELSYRAELRAERPEKRARLFDAAPQYYEAVTRVVVDRCSYPVVAIEGADSTRYRARIADGVRLLSRFTWALRSWQGKLLSVLRLVKAMATFEGGVDYILWKINRHSGVSVEVEPRLRRHPLLAMWVLSWRLYRRGGFH